MKKRSHPGQTRLPEWLVGYRTACLTPVSAFVTVTYVAAAEAAFAAAKVMFDPSVAIEAAMSTPVEAAAVIAVRITVSVRIRVGIIGAVSVIMRVSVRVGINVRRDRVSRSDRESEPYLGLGRGGCGKGQQSGQRQDRDS